ncbi:MAG TPA: hypothetical protein VLL52_23050, partial [Anaerolineae bacterium]|nr:hypothetical protein [Anaerolineae bacterium]
MVGVDLAPGTCLDFGGGRATSVLDVVMEIYRLVGGEGRPRPGLLPNRPAEAATQVADLGLTAEVLGWRPEVDLETGLGWTIERFEG